MRLNDFIKFIVLLALSETSLALSSKPVRQPHINASLISSQDTVKPGDKLELGLYLQPDDGWHVYWRNPGDSGMPPKVIWTVPEAVQVSEFAWPRPEIIKVEHLVNFGYHHNLVLPVELGIDKTFGDAELRINAKASWLVCKEECIPGQANLQLAIPRGASLKTSKEAALIDKYTSQVPEPLELLSGDLQLLEGKVVLEVYADSPLFRRVNKLAFFPVNEDIVAYNPLPSIRWKNNYVHIIQEGATGLRELPERFEGVLVGDDKYAWRILIHRSEN